jgi:hypothetical protein
LQCNLLTEFLLFFELSQSAAAKKYLATILVKRELLKVILTPKGEFGGGQPSRYSPPFLLNRTTYQDFMMFQAVSTSEL